MSLKHSLTQPLSTVYFS